VQIKITSDQLNEDTSIANGLGSMLYLWGSRLELDDELLDSSQFSSEVLFTTSAEAWESDYVPGPLSPRAMIQDPDRMVGRAPLAVLLRGQLPNAFAEGEIPDWTGVADSLQTPGPVEEFPEAESSVVVIGCSKMFEDSFMRMVPGNGMLLLNAVDALTLGDDLIEIRAKVTTQRTLRPLSDQARLFIKVVVVALVPVLVAAFGMFRHLRRRREETRFLAAQAHPEAPLHGGQ
jgi:ABC-2 type transport system permease protein